MSAQLPIDFKPAPIDLRVDAWRLRPHTYAQVVSRGKWKPYRHLTYLSERITPGLIQGFGERIQLGLHFERKASASRHGSR